MPQVIGVMPPEPDHVAPRGTDQWRNAVTAKKKWISKQLARGVSLDDLVDYGAMDRWGEEGTARAGRESHDYEYWRNALEGKSIGDEGLPAELGEAQWDVGNFQKQAARGDYTEWPPGSGIYFNDPGNNSAGRQFFNSSGDRISQPGNFDLGFDIDYDAVNSGYGGNIRKYLEDEQKHRNQESKAPKGLANGVYNAPQTSSAQPVAQPVANNMGGVRTGGAWGVTNFSTALPQQQRRNTNMQGMAQPMAGPTQSINPFSRQSNAGFSRPQGYQTWRR